MHLNYAMVVSDDPYQNLRHFACFAAVCTNCSCETTLNDLADNVRDAIVDATYARQFEIELADLRREEESYSHNPASAYHPVTRRLFVQDSIDRLNEKLGTFRIMCPKCQHGQLVLSDEFFEQLHWYDA